MVETYDDAICMIINGKINVFQKLVNVKFRPLCPIILYKSDVLMVNLTESDVKKRLSPTFIVGKYLSGTNTKVPEEELITISVDSSEQSRARLQLQPIPRRASFASPDPEVVGSVSPDGDPYRRQPLQVQAYGPKSKL